MFEHGANGGLMVWPIEAFQRVGITIGRNGLGEGEADVFFERAALVGRGWGTLCEGSTAALFEQVEVGDVARDQGGVADAGRVAVERNLSVKIGHALQRCAQLWQRGGGVHQRERHFGGVTREQRGDLGDEDRDVVR